MPLFFNGTPVPPASGVYFGGARMRTVVYNGTVVWRSSVQVTNLVPQHAEVLLPWGDIGHTGAGGDIARFTAQAGRSYFVRTGLSYFAYGPTGAENWWAFAQISLDGAVKLYRNGHGWPNDPPESWHGIVHGDGAQHLLRLDMERYNSPQGNVQSVDTMVVDATELGGLTADEIWQKIGFFRGTKTIQL